MLLWDRCRSNVEHSPGCRHEQRRSGGN